MEHHAYLVAGSMDEGKAAALGAAVHLLGASSQNNPDIIVREYGLFSVDDARALYRMAWQSPLKGEKKALIMCASRIYHEAQNALLKLFEEPPADTVMYLVVPSAGSIIATLQSRLMPLPGFTATTRSNLNFNSQGSTLLSETLISEFLAVNKEKRSVLIKKLADAQGEEKKRAARDSALAILNGVEQAVYDKWQGNREDQSLAATLEDIAILRGYLQDRSAPLRMILEHVSLTLPKGLTSYT